MRRPKLFGILLDDNGKPLTAGATKATNANILNNSAIGIGGNAGGQDEDTNG